MHLAVIYIMNILPIRFHFTLFHLLSDNRAGCFQHFTFQLAHVKHCHRKETERLRLLPGWVCSSSAFLLFPNRVGNNAKLPKSPDHSPETGESRELFCVQGSPGSDRSLGIRIQEAGSPLLLGSFSGKGERGDAPKFLVYFIKLAMNRSACFDEEYARFFPERCMPSLGIP